MTPATESKLKELIEFARTRGLTELVWQENDVRIAFRRSNVSASSRKAASVKKESAEPAAPKEDYIRAPMVGTFRRAGSKDRPPLILEGNHVKPGDRMGVVECMKIPTDVVSFCQGQITRILVEDGQVVEYGQPLFALVPMNGASANGQ